MENIRPSAPGRGSNLRPPNRFTAATRSVPLDVIDPDPDEPADRHLATVCLADRSRSVVSTNDSPDVGFRYSVNPYRGCEHGCAYCYARPTHEYLGYDAGLDFETKLLVKHDAPALFRDFLARDRWVPEPVALSGVTDPYQPIERTYRLTRRCLEVAAACRQPVIVITKNSLVVRDLDVLAPMAAAGLVRVNVSIATLDAALARSMEPRAATPAARLRAVRALSDAGVPVRVLVAPVVPGLTDAGVPAVLAAARAAGAARAAAYTLLRLPLTVAPVFEEWLRRAYPDRAEKVLGRVRDMRGGKLYDSAFGSRMLGTGMLADQLAGLFRVFTRKYELDGKLPPLDCSRFHPPPDRRGQGRLF